MTKEEFQAWLEEQFFAWTGQRPRTLQSWLVSLEDFSRMKYDEENKKQK